MFFYQYVSEYNILLTPLDIIAIILWIISIFILAAIGFTFYKDSQKLNKMFLSLALFFLLFSVSRILRITAKYIIGYPYGMTDFRGTLLVLAILFNTISYFGIFMYYLYVEGNVLRKTYHIMSGLVIVVVILSFITYFIPDTIFILTVPYLIVILGLPVVYAYLAIITEGSVRKNALLVMAGALLFLLGNAFDVPSIAKIIAGIPGLPEIAQISAPPLQIVGAIMIRMGFPRKA
jgi:hypothetical protein